MCNTRIPLLIRRSHPFQVTRMSAVSLVLVDASHVEWILTRSSPPEASMPNLGLNLTHRLATPSTPPLCNLTQGSNVIHLGLIPGTIGGPCNFSCPSAGFRSHTQIDPSPEPEMTNFESPLHDTSSPLARSRAVWPRSRRTIDRENASRI